MLELQPRGATPVFSGVPGRIQSVEVRPGQQVAAGEVLARLDNINLRLEIAKTEGEVEALRAQLEALAVLRHTDDAASLRMQPIAELLATKEKQLHEKRIDLGRLDIIAQTDGYVFPPPVRPKRDLGDGRLPQWSGSPFDKKNEGAFLAASDQFCQIGKSTAYDAVLVVDQADIDLVTQYEQQKQRFPEVKIKLDAYRWKTFDGKIEMVASAPMENTPSSLATQGGGLVETKTDRKTGTLKPISTSYQARVPLSDDDGLFRVGLTGKAKVYTGWRSLGSRVLRYVARTFHFNW
jgi:putative peptide zinc metalloprotease protein